MNLVLQNFDSILPMIWVAFEFVLLQVVESGPLL